MQIVTLILLDMVTIQTLDDPLARGPSSFGSYMPRDTAGFAADVANALVLQGRAKIPASVTVAVIFQAAADGHNAGDTASLTGDVATPLVAAGTVTLSA